MTQKELEDKIRIIHQILGTNPDLGRLSDDQIYVLLAWEFRKDGMDWDMGVESIARGRHPLFNTRGSAVMQLQNVFGYQTRLAR